MNFRTEINLQPAGSKIDYHSSIFLSGSCFSESIAEKLTYYKFRQLSNPFGVIYNPFSLAEELRTLIRSSAIDPGDLFLSQDTWRHFNFHSRLAHPDRDVAVKQMNRAIENATRFLKSSTHVFITFGTAICYKLRSSGKIVANNHKIPSDQFEKFMAEPADIA